MDFIIGSDWLILVGGVGDDLIRLVVSESWLVPCQTKFPEIGQ